MELIKHAGRIPARVAREGWDTNRPAVREFGRDIGGVRVAPHGVGERSDRPVQRSPPSTGVTGDGR